MAQIELGDVLGLDTAWLGELHFSRPFSTLADPLMVLAAAAQRTRRIRLGTAVTLLPLHNPVKMAEQAATADLLSDGRLEFGVGRGTAPIHYAGYDIPQEESRERFEEALDFILAAWTHETFSYEGKYFRARDRCIVPRPVQDAASARARGGQQPRHLPARRAARLTDLRHAADQPAGQAPGGLGVYRTAMPAGAKVDAALAFPVHVDDEPGESAGRVRAELAALLPRGRRAAPAVRRSGHQELRSLSAGPGSDAAGEVRRHRPRDGRLRRPEYCVQRVRALRREYEMDEFICYFNQGGIMDHATVKASMTLFAREVMPYCR